MLIITKINHYCNDIAELFLAVYADDTLLLSQDKNIFAAIERLRMSWDILARRSKTGSEGCDWDLISAQVFAYAGYDELPPLTLNM